MQITVPLQGPVEVLVKYYPSKDGMQRVMDIFRTHQDQGDIRTEGNE
jgi:hypothetical protein